MYRTTKTQRGHRKKKMVISRTYAIMIPYVRNHDPVRTQSLSRTYAIISRTYAIIYLTYAIISHTYAIYPVRTQSLSRTYVPPPHAEHRMVATFCTVFVAIIIIIMIHRKINLKIQSLTAPVLKLCLGQRHFFYYMHLNTTSPRIARHFYNALLFVFIALEIKPYFTRPNDNRTDMEGLHFFNILEEY